MSNETNKGSRYQEKGDDDESQSASEHNQHLSDEDGQHGAVLFDVVGAVEPDPDAVDPAYGKPYRQQDTDTGNSAALVC